MKRIFLASAFALAASAALGQGVNSVPQVGVISSFANAKQTYSAAFIGLVPAASATDVVCLSGSASKTVRITRISLSGTAGTLVTLPVTLLARTALNTGGTAASTTANPANTIRGNDSANATATAVPISYTANPTLTDSSPKYVRSAALTLPVTSAGVVSAPWVAEFPTSISIGTQALTLRGAAAQVCLNLNGVSVSSGVLTGSLEWTEE
jgi:hypothetical protein